jgi:glucose-1-phosphate thymidylyltransferase
MSSAEIGSRVVGLVPAAGSARRLPGLPLSKELYPIGFVEGADGVLRPKPAITHVLSAFRDAGIASVLTIIRAGKWDIPEYLRDGEELALNIAYVVTPPTPSVVHTLDRVYPFVADRVVALGFPDILFGPRDAYGALLARLAETEADIVLGLFQADRPEKTDMVALDTAGRPVEIVIKQADRGLRFTWSIAVWRPTFSELLRRAVRRCDDAGRSEELQLGEVIQGAIDEGRRVEAITFEQGKYLDIGTPEDLLRAIEYSLRHP